LLAVLPFLDNMERAIGQEGASADAILTGVKMIYDSLLTDLGKFGLSQISSEGEMFDPSRHEAVGAMPASGMPEGVVLFESRKGYLLNGRLLRPAHVLVAAAQVSDVANEQED
jgi:molecular chaperone GrpE